MVSTEYPGVSWLLDCEPRVVQLEAIARAYTGLAYRLNKDEPMPNEPIYRLNNSGGPAVGFPFFMEMRLGKTPTWLNEYLLFVRDHGIKRGLMFSPSKYKTAWGMEAERFGLPHFDQPVHVFESSDRGRKEAAQFIKAGEGLMVVNYEALLYGNNMKLLFDWVDDRTSVGADESVLIKNRNSLFFKRAHELAKDAGVIRPLTGKPIVQGPDDLYSQLRFARLLNGVIYHEFRNQYCKMGGFKGKKAVGTRNEDDLRRYLNRHSFPAQRRDWGTWFEPDYVTRRVQMTEAQERAYKEMEEDFVVWLDNGEAISVEQIITKRMKMQQIASGFIFDKEREVHWLVPPAKNPKLQELKDDLENYVTGKTIVVAVHGPAMDLLLDELREYNPAVIRGGRDDTEEQKYRFNNDPNCRVMVAQEKAVKYGHTLMGNAEDRCETIAFFENTYSLDDRAQALERPQGEGQQTGTVVLDYTTGGVEDDIISALQSKEDIAHAIMKFYGKA